ncbi:MAG: hypothetical protein Q9203_006734, partial [Teloschistes exilis]
MNLVCPPGSYDANVEPAKDDVLFTDSSRVLDTVENFFKSIYGQLRSKEKSTSKGKTSVSKSQAFDLLLAKRKSPAAIQPGSPALPRKDSPIYVETGEPDELFGDSTKLPMDKRRSSPKGDSSAVNESTSTDIQSSPILHLTGAQHTWQQSMCEGDDHDELPDVHTASQDQDVDAEDLRDVRVSNPWTLAKLNAPLRPRNPNGLSGNGQLLTPAKHHDGMVGDLSSPLRMDPAAANQTGLPSPEKSDALTPFEEPSDDSFPYPLRRWGKARRKSASRSNPLPSDDAPSSSLLDTWMQRPSALPQGTRHEDLFADQHDFATSRPLRDFVSASELPRGTLLSCIPDVSQKPGRKVGLRKQRQVGNVNKPFKPPVVHDEERVWFDHLGPSSSARSPKKKAAQHLPSSIPYRDVDGDGVNDLILDSSSFEPQHPGLALTMDYEARKAAATAQRRAFLKEQAKSSPIMSAQRLEEEEMQQGTTQIKISASQQSQQPVFLPSSLSPHRNRYNAAVAALRAPSSSSISPSKAGKGTEKNIELPGPQLGPKDPRAYLLREGKGKKN